MLSAVYTVDDEGLEQDGAVLGDADGFVNHAGFSGSPRLERGRQGEARKRGWRGAGRGTTYADMVAADERGQLGRPGGGAAYKAGREL